MKRARPLILIAIFLAILFLSTVAHATAQTNSRLDATPTPVSTGTPAPPGGGAVARTELRTGATTLGIR